MKRLFITFSTLSLLLITLTTCSYNDLVSEQSGQETVGLRSMGAETTHYYWFRGERIGLTVNMDYVHAIMYDGFLESDRSSVFQTFNIEQCNSVQIDGMVKLRLRPEGARTRSMSALSDYVETVDALKKSGKVRYVFPFFERGGGAPPIGTSYVFYLKLRAESDIATLKEVANRHNVQIIEQVPYMPLWYILSLQGSGFSNSIEASNYFFETGYFSAVDPAFMFHFTPNCVNDPMFNQQWGLRNIAHPGIDINVCNAWTIATTRGAGVNIAVIDKPIDPNHNDLRPFHHLSFDAQSGRSPSVATGARHGTLVAGIIAARNNGLQVVGVAPESRIIRISHSLQISNTASAEFASGITWAWREANADIINNSWGDQSGRYHALLRSEILETAITNALTLGRYRNGVRLGTIVVFASGNIGLPNRVDYPGCVHPDILVVGAIDRDGRRSSFSNHGFQLDVVAPGRDILSTLHENRTCRDLGTSLAAPHVAGVAALILSVNPNLTVQQVGNIIKKTANRNLPGFTTCENRPNGRWNREVGYGLVNAYAAVRAARDAATAITGPTTVCPGVTNAVFELQRRPPNTTIRWFADAPLVIVGPDDLNNVTIRHTGATTPSTSRVRAEISMNERVVHTVYREVVVNRPNMTPIVPPHGTLQTGRQLAFTVNHTGTSLTWSVSPNTGVTISTIWDDMVRNIRFTHPGNYTITVTSTNECGTSIRHLNVNITAPELMLPPPFACPLCGFYPLQYGMACPCIIGLRVSDDDDDE